jgi:hypothetical protein
MLVIPLPVVRDDPAVFELLSDHGRPRGPSLLATRTGDGAGKGSLGWSRWISIASDA